MLLTEKIKRRLNSKKGRYGKKFDTAKELNE